MSEANGLSLRPGDGPAPTADGCARQRVLDMQHMRLDRINWLCADAGCGTSLRLRSLEARPTEVGAPTTAVARNVDR
jgi:hypothetical protein